MFRPLVEMLECRTLLSDVDLATFVAGTPHLVVLTSNPRIELTSKGTLVVHGANVDENITISRKAGTILVQIDPPTRINIGQTRPASAVKRILIEGNGGDDRVIVRQNVNKRATLLGGSGNDALTASFGDTLIGGSGNDSLSVPARHTFDVRTGDVTAGVINFGPSLLSGGEGNDTFLADRDDIIVGGKGSDSAGEALNAVNFTHGDTILFRSIDVKADLEANSSGVETFGGMSVELKAQA